MGLFSSKPKTDPQFAASQQAAVNVANMMANAQLPALPVIPQAATPAVNVPTSLPSYLGGGAGTVFPAGLPNQLSMIANQLSAGGYGAPQAIRSQLSGIYKPMVVAPQPPPAPVAPQTPAAPAAPAAAAPAAAAPAPAPAVQKPMGFTAQQSYQSPRELYTTGGSLNQGPVFALPSDFLRFLNNPSAYTGSINRSGSR